MWRVCGVSLVAGEAGSEHGEGEEVLGPDPWSGDPFSARSRRSPDRLIEVANEHDLRAVVDDLAVHVQDQRVLVRRVLFFDLAAATTVKAGGALYEKRAAAR
jgi:hypothetical protein